MKTFRSNGKLLITGEYTVLDKALALAVPTKFGQTLEVNSTDSQMVNWTALKHDGKIWFKADSKNFRHKKWPKNRAKNKRRNSLTRNFTSGK